MFKKILRICSFLIFFISIATTSFFTDIKVVQAVQMVSDNTEENSLGIVIEEANDSLDGSKTSATPDLGDDQTFPFIPGFGKNSGKDWVDFLNNSLNT